MASPPPASFAPASVVVQSAFSRFSECAMGFEPIANATSAISGQTAVMQAELLPSVPPQAFYFLGLLIGLALLFIGFMLVRPINFTFGIYLGGSISVLLLTLFLPSSTSCMTILWVPIVSALLLGVLFAWKRGSLFAIMGLIAGEIVGRIFFDVVLSPIQAPSFFAFSCIGFFAVVISCLMFYVGDRIWTILCAFAGAYLATKSFSELLIIPLFPELHLDRFAAFELPELARAGDSEYRIYYYGYVTREPAIFVPLICVALIGVIGTVVQIKLSSRKQTKNTEQAVSDKALL